MSWRRVGQVELNGQRIFHLYNNNNNNHKKLDWADKLDKSDKSIWMDNSLNNIININNNFYYDHQICYLPTIRWYVCVFMNWKLWIKKKKCV